jgi:hypothetical protein
MAGNANSPARRGSTSRRNFSRSLALRLEAARSACIFSTLTEAEVAFDGDADADADALVAPTLRFFEPRVWTPSSLSETTMAAGALRLPLLGATIAASSSSSESSSSSSSSSSSTSWTTRLMPTSLRGTTGGAT